jgi:hypothetical protein
MILIAVLLRPVGERTLIERGMIYTIMTYDLVLPLLGLGIAASQMRRWQAVLVAAVFAGGVPVGIEGEYRLLAEGRISIQYAGYFAFAGPLCCVMAAAALAFAGRARSWITPVAALLSGVALGFAIALHHPSVGDLRFPFGATAGGLWLISLAPAILRPFDRSWLRIGGRIFASWLVAIGLMLGGAKLVAMERADRAVTGSLPQSLSQPFDQPGPALDENPPPLVQPHEWGDPSRQP